MAISNSLSSVNTEPPFFIDCPIAGSWYERFSAIDLLLPLPGLIFSTIFFPSVVTMLPKVGKLSE